MSIRIETGSTFPAGKTVLPAGGQALLHSRLPGLGHSGKAPIRHRPGIRRQVRLEDKNGQGSEYHHQPGRQELVLYAFHRLTRLFRLAIIRQRMSG